MRKDDKKTKSSTIHHLIFARKIENVEVLTTCQPLILNVTTSFRSDLFLLSSSFCACWMIRKRRYRHGFLNVIIILLYLYISDFVVIKDPPGKVQTQLFTQLCFLCFVFYNLSTWLYHCKVLPSPLISSFLFIIRLLFIWMHGGVVFHLKGWTSLSLLMRLLLSFVHMISIFCL
jgi:hypothetical protein